MYSGLLTYHQWPEFDPLLWQLAIAMVGLKFDSQTRLKLSDPIKDVYLELLKSYTSRDHFLFLFFLCKRGISSIWTSRCQSGDPSPPTKVSSIRILCQTNDMIITVLESLSYTVLHLYYIPFYSHWMKHVIMFLTWDYIIFNHLNKFDIIEKLKRVDTFWIPV